MDEKLYAEPHEIRRLAPQWAQAGQGGKECDIGVGPLRLDALHLTLGQTPEMQQDGVFQIGRVHLDVLLQMIHGLNEARSTSPKRKVQLAVGLIVVKDLDIHGQDSLRRMERGVGLRVDDIDPPHENDTMPIELAPVDRESLHQTFLDAFADYAMDARGTTDSSLMLRMAKNAVDYDASVGAYADDRMVGFTLIGIDTMPQGMTAYDAGTGLIPAYRSRRIAHRMFEHALPDLRCRGVKRFLLEVLQQNEPAIKTYRKSGFEIVRTLRSYVADVGALRAEAPADGVRIDAASSVDFERLCIDGDWIPSFENRFSAPRAIPSEVAFYGAYDDETCVGIVAYCARLNWLLSLIVKRSHRRRGIGRCLLNHLGRHLPQGVGRLAVLNVDGGDIGMQRFFTSCGFRFLVDQYEMARSV